MPLGGASPAHKGLSCAGLSRRRRTRGNEQCATWLSRHARQKALVCRAAQRRGSARRGKGCHRARAEARPIGGVAPIPPDSSAHTWERALCPPSHGWVGPEMVRCICARHSWDGPCGPLPHGWPRLRPSAPRFRHASGCASPQHTRHASMSGELRPRSPRGRVDFHTGSNPHDRTSRQCSNSISRAEVGVASTRQLTCSLVDVVLLGRDDDRRRCVPPPPLSCRPWLDTVE